MTSEEVNAAIGKPLWLTNDIAASALEEEKVGSPPAQSISEAAKEESKERPKVVEPVKTHSDLNGKISQTSSEPTRFSNSRYQMPHRFSSR